MTYQTYQEFVTATNNSGILSILLYSNAIWPGTTPLLLFAFFCISFIGIYLGQKASFGDGNPIIAFAVSMTFVMMISSILALKSGLINLPTLLIVFVLWVVSMVLIFTHKDKSSV